MLRTCILICVLFLFAGCEKNWRGLMIEKRVYRDGYYVHLPWKRYTPKNEYPKPEPYPVDHSRNAPTDSTRQTVCRVPSDSAGSVPPQTGGSAGSAGGNYSAPVPSGGTSPGGYGTGSPSSPTVIGRPETGAGSDPSSAPPENTPATSVPATILPVAQLQSEPVIDPVLPQRNVVSVDSIPTDSLVAADSIPIDSSIAKEHIQFPEGEFSLVAEAGFYNSANGKSIEVNPFSCNAGFGARYTIHPWSRHKISGEAGLFVSNMSVRQEQRKATPLFSEEYDSERIMQWKMRFMMLDHIYITRNASALIDAIEFGIISDVGFFSTHIAVNNEGNDGTASFTRNKSRRVGLKYLRNVQHGFTLRIANDRWSGFINYRWSALISPAFTKEDLPALVFGVTRSFAG